MEIEGIDIRLLTGADAGTYVLVRRAALESDPLAFSGSPGADACSDEAWVRDRLGEPGQAIAGAFDGARLVGVAGVFRDTRPKLAHRATVWGVWVHPRHRGRRIGEALVRRVVEAARSWGGVRSVGLSVAVTGVSAMRVYERIGFVRWGVEPGVVLYDGEEHDEVHMQLRIG